MWTQDSAFLNPNPPQVKNIRENSIGNEHFIKFYNLTFIYNSDTSFKLEFKIID